MNGRLASAPEGDAQARVAAMVNTHGPALLRVAQRVSLCSDDANDALQRALEIYWRRVDSLDPATEAAWLRVVVRNEALAIRKARQESVAAEDVDLDLQPADARSPEDRIESSEVIERSAEALHHLKRDEATALMLKAEGHSYDEIGERLAWTRTKVNRALTEGRARFFKVFRNIENGEQCERFAPLLAQLAVGQASSDDLLFLRPHLRHCRACRAHVRQLHSSRLQRVAALLPIPAMLRPSQLKADLYSLFGRVGGGDPALAAAGSGSGGRSFGAAALVGLCLGGAGAGGYCLATGKLPDPVSIVSTREPVKSRPSTPRVVVTARATRTPAPPPAARVPSTTIAPAKPRPTPSARRARRRLRPAPPRPAAPQATAYGAPPPPQAAPAATAQPDNSFANEFAP